ncbi:MAG: alpha/beta fold hydrolase [Bacteroidetes bacterium]|nr:alpha/beta fold hydrolase [Bacteroidota bacterium]
MKQIVIVLFLLVVNANVYCQNLLPEHIANSVFFWFTTGKFEKIEEQWDKSVLEEAKITDLAEQLEDLWQQLVIQNGNFESISEYAELDTTNGMLIVRNIIFENDSIGLSVNVNKDNLIIGLFMVPPIILDYKDADYVDTSKFEEFDVEFAENNDITGKITIPKNIDKGKKVQCVVLVHGSGPQDLDQTIFGRKPFRDIAFGLSSNNIAVLRYDKRTYLGKIKDVDNFTIDEESVDDAVSAVDFIKNNYADKIDKIYVLGHSQGGYVMPRISKKSKNTEGFISIAGNARSIPELMKYQYEYLGDLFGLDKKYLEPLTASCDIILSGNFTKDTPASELINSPAAYWLDLKNYNPTQEFKNEKRPILFIQGGRDYQVTMTDFNLWKKDLSKNKNVKFVVIDELNHLMQEGEGRSVPTEYKEPIHVSKKIIDNILQWLKIHK